ncbi:MAG: alkaline phosphatase family protein, partial [Clostridia bacterium]|nr:alkaline phosphatase family protein [Clostridia bacterium]
MNHKHKIIVISFDGLGTDDWKIVSKMPGFARFMKEAAYCEEVQSVYPTLTYPAHCSIATGRLPIHHRVVHNLLLQPHRMASPDWYWKRSYVQGKTMYEAAKECGLKTASFLWPVTAGAKIDYHVPEIFANRKWDHQILA